MVETERLITHILWAFAIVANIAAMSENLAAKRYFAVICTGGAAVFLLALGDHIDNMFHLVHPY